MDEVVIAFVLGQRQQEVLLPIEGVIVELILIWPGLILLVKVDLDAPPLWDFRIVLLPDNL